MDVSVAVDVGDCDPRFADAIQLGRAFARDVSGIDHAQTRTLYQRGQAVEMTSLAYEGRSLRKRTSNREIEVQSERQTAEAPRTRKSFFEVVEIHDHRSGGDRSSLCRFENSCRYAARKTKVIGVHDQPTLIKRIRHAL